MESYKVVMNKKACFLARQDSADQGFLLIRVFTLLSFFTGGLIMELGRRRMLRMLMKRPFIKKDYEGKKFPKNLNDKKGLQHVFNLSTRFLKIGWPLPRRPP
jgi:hypothetical protein